ASGGVGQRIVGGKLIAGDLPANKLVVRQIVIQRLDDKVAVLVGKRPIGIALLAVAVGIARHIEPVSAPTLAVMRRRQQTIDQRRYRRKIVLLVGGLELRDLFSPWRQ